MPEQTPILDALETSAIINRKDKPGQVPWTEWRVPVVTASGGPSSEGSIPMLDANGQIDPSMIPGGGSVNYFFTQSAASTTWVIVHDLGKHPSVSIEDTTHRQVYAEVQYDSLDQVTLTFAAPESGYASLN